MLKRSVFVLVIAAFLMTGCVSFSGVRPIAGSGHMATRSYEVSGFTAIDAGSAFKVMLFPGDRYLAEVTIDDNLLDYVTVTKQGDSLSVNMESGRAFSSFHGGEVRITMPDLRRIRLNGASQATIGNGFQHVDRFEADLNGASQLHGYIYAGDARLDGTGASQITLSGKAATVSLSLGGASRADLSGLAVDQVNTTLDGASNATVNPAQSLDYSLHSASHLRYGGSPRIGLAQTSGASSAARQ